MQEVQKCVFIMNLKLALFLKDKYIQQTQKTEKGGQKITFKKAKMLDAKDILSVSGFQLCCLCFEEAQTHCHNVSEWKIMISSSPQTHTALKPKKTPVKSIQK